MRIAVYFHQVPGLREGAPFVVAGREVGTIETIGFSARGAPGPLLGEEGVKVSIALDADMAARIERGGDVFVASKGPIGERFVEIGPSPQPSAPLVDGLELLGRDPPSMDRVLQRTWDNLNIARAFADAIGPEVVTLRTKLRELDETLDSLGHHPPGTVPSIGGIAGLRAEVRAFADELAELRDVSLGGEAGRAKLDAVITDARATLARGRQVLDRLGTNAQALGAAVDTLRARAGKRGPPAVAAIERAIDRLRAAIDKIDPLLAKVQDIQGRLARGEGSIGRLMKDPEFPEDAKELGRILKRQPWKIFARPQK